MASILVNAYVTLNMRYRLLRTGIANSITIHIGMKMKKIVLALVMLSLSGCSVYKVMSQEGPADLNGLGVGSSRQELIQRLGYPKITDVAANGDKQDIFEFRSGVNQAAKLRFLPYLAADVFTIGLAEIVLYPLEASLFDSATCIGIATYDSTMKVNTWGLSLKKSSSEQSC